MSTEQKPKQIIIDGVTITPQVLDVIRVLQSEDKSLAIYTSAQLAHVICFLIDCEPPVGSEIDKMNCLNILKNARNYFVQLSA